MPPQIPVRFPWISKEAISCSNGLRAASYVRTFVSTSRCLALGPESPNYIEVPKPVQPTFPLKPQVKGHLPVPRNVFKTRSRLAKESDKFIALTTKNEKKVKVPGPYSRDADYRLHKQRLAEARKTAFRVGVKELHERKTTMEAQHSAKIQRVNAERRKLAMAPPRAVDVLTQTSVSKSIRDFLDNKLPSRSRLNISQARRKAYERRMAKQDAVRRARVHDLYTNAREFIVNEEQLDQAIEKAFGTDENPMLWTNRGEMLPWSDGSAAGLSPWEGPMPEGVSDKLQKLKGGEGVGLAKERVKKVAEALTGGKM